MKDSHPKNLPDTICWYEGMMLSPQHFQQHQIYWEAQFHALRDALSPNGWGLQYLEFDHGHLLEGELIISKLKAIMPDGLLIDYDAQFAAPLKLTLSDIEQLDQQRKVTIHLVVPIRTPGCASDTASIQRYESRDSTPVVDDNTGQGEIVMQRLVPQIALQAIDHVSKKYTSVPLMQVIQPDPGNFQLGDYCPPLVNIAAQNFAYAEAEVSARQTLQIRCKNLAFTMRKKARQLAGYSEPGEEKLGHRISEVHLIWIQVLTKLLPQFELMAEDGNTPPYQLYAVLAELMGNFARLDADCIPPKLPAYQHDQVLEGFNIALEYLKRQLDVVNLRYTSIHFEESREGVFSLQYDKAWTGQELLVELSAYDKGTTEELVSWFKACRIASPKMHDVLAKGRLLGADAELVENDKATGISVAPGRALFLIKADSNIILPGQKLIVLCTDGALKADRPKRITLHLPHEART